MAQMPQQEVTLKMSLMKEEKAKIIKISKHFRKNLRKVLQKEGTPVINDWQN